MAAPWETESSNSSDSSDVAKKKFLSEKLPIYQEYEEWSKKPVGYRAAESIPYVLGTAGAIGGGAIGAATPIPGAGLLGTVSGASSGQAAGKYLENKIKTNMYGEQISPEQNTEDIKTAAMYGGGLELVGPTARLGKRIGGSFTGGLLSKGTETLTGIPQKTIQTYTKHADEINAMSKSSNGDIAVAADEIRTKFSNDIQKAKSIQNDALSKSLEQSNKTVTINDTVQALNSVKEKLNPTLHGKDIAEINDILSKISKLEIKEPVIESPNYRDKPWMQNFPSETETNYKSSGNISVKDAHDLKQYMQGRVSESYKKPGDIFTENSGASRAIKDSASKIRNQINEAEPSIAKANNSLAELHEIEDDLNRNLIAEGKPHAALISAGTGGNPRNALNLRKLGDYTGTDMNADAEKLAAMQHFSNPSWTPVDTTGKASTRLNLARSAGAAIGGIIGGIAHGVEGAAGGAAIGGYAGGLLSSPAVVKQVMDASRFLGKTPEFLMNDPNGRIMLRQFLGSKLNEKQPEQIKQTKKAPWE